MAAALAEAAAAAGATSAVHACWGATLYHPADLPSATQFREAAGAKPPRAPRGSGAAAGAAAAGPATECGGTREQGEGAVDLRRVGAVPGVMTNFIKVRALAGTRGAHHQLSSCTWNLVGQVHDMEWHEKSAHYFSVSLG